MKRGSVIFRGLLVWCALAGVLGCQDRLQGSGRTPVPASDEQPHAALALSDEEVFVVQRQPSGTVWTVLTHIGRNAPAATREVAAALEVTLFIQEEESLRVVIPLGGRATMADEAAIGSGVFRVRVLNPWFEQLASNEIAVSELGGTLGVLLLEISPSGENRGCLQCSPPEALAPVPGLHSTSLYWSGHSGQASTEDVALHVAFRVGISQERQEELVRSVGAVMVNLSEPRADQDNWVVIQASDRRSLMAVAIELAEKPEIEGLELFSEGLSGILIVDPSVFRQTSEPLPTEPVSNEEAERAEEEAERAEEEAEEP